MTGHAGLAGGRWTTLALADQLANVAVEGAGAPIRLGDVTSVVEDHPKLIGDATEHAAYPDRLDHAASQQALAATTDRLLREPFGQPVVDPDAV